MTTGMSLPVDTTFAASEDAAASLLGLHARPVELARGAGAGMSAR